jgi:hypothetical protein
MRKNVRRAALRARIRQQPSAGFIPFGQQIFLWVRVQKRIGSASSVEHAPAAGDKGHRAFWNTSSTKALWKVQVRRNFLRIRAVYSTTYASLAKRD